MTRESELEDFYGIVYALDRMEVVEDYCDFMRKIKIKIYKNNFLIKNNYLEYGSFKRDTMTRLDQYFLIRHSGCGSLVNKFEIYGTMEVQKQMKFNKESLEISLSNGFCKVIHKPEGNKLISIEKGKKEIKIMRVL
jgi:hypothetical protein